MGVSPGEIEYARNMGVSPGENVIAWKTGIPRARPIMNYCVFGLLLYKIGTSTILHI